MTEGVVDRLQAIDVEHDQRATRMIALDVGDRTIEFALEAAPVRNAEQEVGIRGSLQFLDSRQRLRQLGPEPANGWLGVIGRRRRPGRNCTRFDRFGSLWCGVSLRAGCFAAFGGPRSDSPGFLLHRTLERLAGINQDRIVHSGPPATPCRSLGRSYTCAYVFGFPNRIDRMTAPIAIIMGSQSDWDTMRHAAETLTTLGVGCEKHIVSAHRT